MFGIFKKKETVEEVERHEIPKENRMEVYVLLDNYEAETGGRREKFAMWTRLQGIFPELDLSVGDWTIDLRSILIPSIYKKLT